MQPHAENENGSYSEKEIANQKAGFQNPAMLLDESDEIYPHGKLSFNLDSFSKRNKQDIYTISLVKDFESDRKTRQATNKKG